MIDSFLPFGSQFIGSIRIQIQRYRGTKTCQWRCTRMLHHMKSGRFLGTTFMHKLQEGCAFGRAEVYCVSHPSRSIVACFLDDKNESCTD
jgi:hypothetical protein